MNLQNRLGNYCTNVLPTISTQKFAAIFGESPSKGARSPTLWNRAFNKLNIDAYMIPVDVKVGAFNDLMDELEQDKNFMGGAIAVPYKEAAWRWCGDRLPQEARNIGAVNCIYRGDNGAVGNNTDGAGAITSLKEKVGDLSEKRILVIGLGGTGKAVSAFLASEMADSKNLILTSRSDAAAKWR